MTCEPYFNTDALTLLLLNFSETDAYQTAVATKYIPMFSNMTPIPYPCISDSESISARSSLRNDFLRYNEFLPNNCMNWLNTTASIPSTLSRF